MTRSSALNSPSVVREYLRFMWDGPQVDAWVTASNGYVAPPTPAWNDNPTADNHPAHADCLEHYASLLERQQQGPARARVRRRELRACREKTTCDCAYHHHWQGSSGGGGSQPDAERRSCLTRNLEPP